MVRLLFNLKFLLGKIFFAYDKVDSSLYWECLLFEF